MARYAYDVNTQTKYIDVHKQFAGGLKTVDTDDSLGTVYLREAENVSISEFGFLEKRYGLYKEGTGFENLPITVTSSSLLQGYFTYKTATGDTHELLFVDGYAMLNTGSGFEIIDLLSIDSTKTYASPQTLISLGLEASNLNYKGNIGVFTDLPVPSRCTDALLFYNQIFTSGFPLLEGYTYIPGITSAYNFYDNKYYYFEMFQGSTYWTYSGYMAGGTSTYQDGYDTGVVYLNTKNSNLYVWNSLDRYSGYFSVYGSNTIGVYDADFTTGKEMEAVRIEDTLYIFTGVYPVYYIGDGNLYLLPEYVPDDVDLENFSHNLMTDDYEDLYYGSPDTFELPSNTIDSSNKFYGFSTSDILVSPKLPYVGSSIQFDCAYEYSGPTETFKSFLKTGTTIPGYDGLKRVITLNLPKVNSWVWEVDYDVVSNTKLVNLSRNFEVYRFFSNLNTSTTYTNYDFGTGGQAPIAPLDVVYDYGTSKFYYPHYDGQGTSVYGYTAFWHWAQVRETPETTTYSIPTTFVEFYNLSTNILDGEFYYSGDSVYFYRDISSTETICVLTKVPSAYLENINPQVNLSNTGVLLELYPTVYSRQSGGTELEWVEVPNNNYTATYVGNNNSISAVFNDGCYDIGDDTFIPYITLEHTAKFIDTVSPIRIVLSGLSEGTYDFKITLNLRKSGFTLDSLKEIFDSETGNYLYDLTHSFKSAIYKSETVVNDVKIYPEQIKDYEEYKPHAMWKCNKVTEHYGKLLVYGSEDTPQTVYVSHPTFKNYFPAYFTMDFTTEDQEIVKQITPFSNILVVQSENYTWGVKGNSPLVDSDAPYTQFTISPIYGTIAPKSVRPVRNYLVFLSKEGVVALTSLYAVDYTYNIRALDFNIKNIVPQDSDAVGIQFDDQYWINFPNYGMTLRYYIDKKAWVKDVYNTVDDFNGVFKYERVGNTLKFITIPSVLNTGENYKIFRGVIDYSLPYDFGTAPVTRFTTAFLDQNYPFHLKNYKETKFDFTLQNEYNLGKEPLPTYEHTADSGFDVFEAYFLKNHTYQIAYASGTITSVSWSLDGNIYTDLGATIGDDSSAVFYIPYNATGRTYLKVVGIEDDNVVLRDVTYDDTITFATWIISDQGTLNLDNITSYEEENAEVLIDLGSRFGEGTWVFDQSPFDNLVTAVKTVKLTGKGYVIQTHFSDASSSKWTLESLGITYKMKKARSS